jgi:diaminopimelate epimerase
MQIAKAHAYGNDFLFVPMEQVEGLRLDTLSRRLCERHAGLGGDGVIYYTTAPDGTARMKLINTDGSPSELSGNGLRCLAALVLHQREQANRPPINEVRVDTDAGWKTLALIGWQGSRYTFRAAMGHPERVAQESLDVAGETITVTTLAIGNPQCVQLVAALPDHDRFNRLGPALSTHQRFTAGTNVEFAVVEAPNRVRILIWERGVGPTHASGTGACASAIAAIAHGGASRDLEVVAPGGTQRVEWREDGIYLTGWAEVVFDGRWIPSAEGPYDANTASGR